MKKIILLVMMVVGLILPTFAQDDITLYIVDHPESMYLCIYDNQRVFIYAQDECDEFRWVSSCFGTIFNESPLIIDPADGNTTCTIDYYGCGGFHHVFTISYMDLPAANGFTRNLWKRFGEIETIEAVGSDSTWYDFLWNTGETTRTIDITEPGTYSVDITSLCGTATRTFIVKDNVEIQLATCDLESNHNMVTWPTTPAQAEYVGQVEIKRDGMVINTVDYSAGTFIDEIGSDAASRTYTITAIGTDGVPCPIESYPKETIHMAYLTGINNTIEVNWNTPTGYDLMGYNICEWNSGSDLRVIDFVGAGVTSYTCQASQFDHGNIVVQGVEATKPETRLLSNRSWETVGVGELSENAFKVFPNPSNGTFTVEGVSHLTVFNTLGQVIATSQSENGKHTFSLASGVYFLKSNVGVARKVVVE